MKPNPLWRLLRLSFPLWRALSLAIVFGSLTILSSVSLMASSAWLISKAALQPSIADLSVVVVAVRFLGISRGVLRYLERLTAHDMTFRFLARLRLEFYQVIEPLAPAGLTNTRGGDLLTRVIDDIESLQNLYLRAVAPFFVALCSALVLSFLLYQYDALVALSALLVTITTATLLPFLAWWSSQKAGQAYVLARAELNANLTEQIQGMAELLVFGQVNRHEQLFQVLRKELHENVAKQAHLDAIQAALFTFFTAGAGILVLAVAIPRIAGIDLASVTLATIASFEALAPLGQAAVQLSSMQEAAARLFEISDKEPAIHDPALPLPLPSRADLQIQQLSFRYQENESLIFDKLDLQLKQGERMVILGESGAGKSSLINLLLRFWDYQQGEIFLGEHELHQYEQSAVRSRFAVMMQRNYLFNTSIRENIRLARHTATDAEVESAAQKAKIHDFILSLPQTYDTQLGENGIQMSGGQRQRIALARTLLSSAPIIILDEPTANLDMMTEKAILETILESTAGRSLILFTHRHVLLEAFDKLYWLDKKLRSFSIGVKTNNLS